MPMTNEPTTGEIVRALREDCSLLDDNTDKFAAADRLESQEQTIAELIESRGRLVTALAELAEKIAELTARAESAERERDDVEKSLARRIMKHLGDNEFDSTFVCEICEYNLTNSPKCLSCGSDYHYGENFELKHTLRG